MVKVIEGLSSHNFGLHNGMLVPNGIYLNVNCRLVNLAGVEVSAAKCAGDIVPNLV